MEIHALIIYEESMSAGSSPEIEIKLRSSNLRLKKAILKWNKNVSLIATQSGENEYLGPGGWKYWIETRDIKLDEADN